MDKQGPRYQETRLMADDLVIFSTNVRERYHVYLEWQLNAR